MFLITIMLMSASGMQPVSFAQDDVKYYFRDDFNEFDTAFWKVIDRYGSAMDMTELSNGILTLKATETDNYPTLISKEIPIELGDILVVKRRVYAHPKHDKFSEGTYITEESDNTWNTARDRSFNFLLFFQHLYFTYDVGRYPENLTKGNFGHARVDGFTSLSALAPENYGITPSTLDEWVEEEFIYETATGKVTITSGGEIMTFQSRVLSKPYARYHMSPWGWYTGQYNQLDWIEFTVLGEDQVQAGNNGQGNAFGMGNGAENGVGAGAANGVGNSGDNGFGNGNANNGGGNGNSQSNGNGQGNGNGTLNGNANTNGSVQSVPQTNVNTNTSSGDPWDEEPPMDYGRILGSVVDSKTDQPIQGARVTLNNAYNRYSNDEVLYEVTSNAEGEFGFIEVAGGSFIIAVEKEGYHKAYYFDAQMISDETNYILPIELVKQDASSDGKVFGYAYNPYTGSTETGLYINVYKGWNAQLRDVFRVLRTDDNGRFEFKDWKGNYTLVFYYGDEPATRLQITLDSENESLNNVSIFEEDGER